jgi:hypothetical protein
LLHREGLVREAAFDLRNGGGVLLLFTLQSGEFPLHQVGRHSVLVCARKGVKEFLLLTLALH